MSLTIKHEKSTWERLKRELAALGQSHAVAGFIAGKNEAHGAGMTNVRLAAIHEFGTARIPARPFMRYTVAERRAAWGNTLRGLVAKGISGGDLQARRVWGLLGARMAADMKNYVMGSNNLAPNAPSTVARKKSSRPLVDTGRLITAIHWAVRQGT